MTSLRARSKCDDDVPRFWKKDKRRRPTKDDEAKETENEEKEEEKGRGRRLPQHPLLKVCARARRECGAGIVLERRSFFRRRSTAPRAARRGSLARRSSFVDPRFSEAATQSDDCLNRNLLAGRALH